MKCILKQIKTPNLPLTNDEEEIKFNINETKKHLIHLRKNGKHLREQFLIEQAQAMELADNFTTAKNLKQLKYIEAVRFKFKKLRMYFDKDKLSSPSTIKVVSENGSEETISDPIQIVKK